MSAKLSEEIRSMYTDAYKLHETYAGMENNEDNWTKVCNTVSEISRHHGDHPLIIQLLIAVMGQLEREVNGA